MDTLAIVQAEMLKYAVKGVNSYSMLAKNDVENLLTVVTVAMWQGKRFTITDLVVRVVDDYVIIEQDANDDPLYEALMQSGISRDKIILAYAGEPVPTLYSLVSLSG